MDQNCISSKIYSELLVTGYQLLVIGYQLLGNYEYTNIRIYQYTNTPTIKKVYPSRGQTFLYNEKNCSREQTIVLVVQNCILFTLLPGDKVNKNKTCQEFTSLFLGRKRQWHQRNMRKGTLSPIFLNVKFLPLSSKMRLHYFI